MSKAWVSGLILIALLPGWSATALAESDGFYIRPHLQNITQDGVTIIWETPQEAIGAVEYGATADLGLRAAGTDAGTIHRVRITGLEAESTYHYRVTAGSDVLESRFKTAPATERPITFVLIGDSRRWEQRWEETKMQDHAAQWEPEFYLTMGDLVANGHKYEQWPEHFERFDGLMDNLWMVTARGNHEGSQIFSPDTDWFAKYHELPGEGEPYAGMVWGNTWIGLISYEATVASPKWIHEALPKVTQRYKILAHHYPVYCSGYYSPDDNRREMGTSAFKPLADAIDRHEVDLDLSGHTHIYERTHPIRAGVRDDANGTTYVINGGDINGQFPSWFTAVQDDKETMAKPTYTVFHMGEDQIWFRTFAWGKEAQEIIEIDYRILPQSDALPRQTLAKLAEAAGDDLLETIETLGAMGVHEAAEPLLAYLAHDADPVREAAATALRRIGIADVSPALAGYLEDANVAVRREVARALEIAMEPGLTEQVAAALNTPGQDTRVSQALVGALEFHAPGAFATKELIRLISQPDTAEKVRERAAHSLARTASLEDVAQLAAMFRQEESTYVTIRLAFILNTLTGRRQPIAGNSPIAQSEPGDARQEFIDKWMEWLEREAA